MMTKHSYSFYLSLEHQAKMRQALLDKIEREMRCNGDPSRYDKLPLSLRNEIDRRLLSASTA